MCWSIFPPETFSINTSYLIREICNSLSFVILKNLNFTVAESKYNWFSFDPSAVSQRADLGEMIKMYCYFSHLQVQVVGFSAKGLHFRIRKNFPMLQLDYFPFKWVAWQRKCFPFRKPTLSDFSVQDLSHSTCKCFYYVFCCSIVGWRMHKVKWLRSHPVAVFAIT